MKNIFKAIGLTVALSLSVPAFAAHYGSASSVVGVGGIVFNATTPEDGADFADDFTFTLGTGTSTNLTFSAIFSNYDVISGTNDYGPVVLPTLTFSLGSVDNTVMPVGNITDPSGSALASSAFSGLSTNAIYTLKLAGTASDGFGSYYIPGGYSVTISAQSVPEPATYALLLASLGLMGVISRRRLKK